MSWPTVKLGDAFWLQEGPGVRNWQFTDSGIKLLNVGNIEKNGYLNLAKTSRHLSTNEAESKYKHFLCDKGDLVIASSGISFDNDGYLRTRGAFIENEHLPLCLNTSTIRFKALNDNNLVFLKHWLQSFEFRKQITMLVTGSAQQNFGPSHLKQIKIKLPPLAQQKRIAAILDKADEIKRKREQAIAKLDQLAQSIFVEMFGNIAINNKGWECALLANVCERAGEYGAGVASIPYSNSLPIYVRITDIDDNGDLSKKPVSPAGNQKDWCNYKLEVGDVLFARSGATVGKTYLHKNTEGYYVFAGYLIRFRPIVSLVNPQFLFHFTKTDFYNAWVIARQRVVAQPNINAKQYGYDLLIPVPPIALQEQFATRISKLEKLKASNIAALEKHNQLFASLQSQAFTGQL